MVWLFPDPCTNGWTDSVLFWYIIAINALAFFVYGYDKWMAQAKAWRVPEAVLLGIALIGGSAGSLAAMNLFRHKTRKIAFQLPLALIVLLHAGLLFWLWQDASTLEDCRTTPAVVIAPQ